MVMTEEKRARFAKLLAHGGAANKAGPFAPLPSPPFLQSQQHRATSPPAPLGENEGVVHIESDEEEECVGEPTFKRRKTTRVATSHSSSAKPLAVCRMNPGGPPLLHLILLLKR
ncbi:hypothetical protein ACSQ67_025614 [Phaseolus vulgaris]